LFCLLKQITDQLSASADNRPTDYGIGKFSADADCQMADTGYRPIIGTPLTKMITNIQQ